MFDQSKCRGEGCTVTVLYAINPETGRTIPLDTRAPVYRAEKRDDGKVYAVRVPDTYVSHFATCTKAGHFSKPRRGLPFEEEGA